MTAKTKQAVTPKFEVFGMTEGESSDFDQKGQAKIERNVKGIKKILTEAGRLVVISSGSPDSMETASALLENPWIQEHSVVEGVSQGHMLGENTLQESDEQTTANVIAQLKAFSGMVIGQARTVEHTGMVLVVGPQFISDIPEKTIIEYDKPVNIAPLALNHFQLDIA